MMTAKEEYQNEQKRKRRTIKYSLFKNIAPIENRLFGRLDRNFPMMKVYKILSQKESVKQKKEQLYKLPYTEKQKDKLWEAYVNKNIL